MPVLLLSNPLLPTCIFCRKTKLFRSLKFRRLEENYPLMQGHCPKRFRFSTKLENADKPWLKKENNRCSRFFTRKNQSLSFNYLTFQKRKVLYWLRPKSKYSLSKKAHVQLFYKKIFSFRVWIDKTPLSRI